MRLVCRNWKNVGVLRLNTQTHSIHSFLVFCIQTDIKRWVTVLCGQNTCTLHLSVGSFAHLSTKVSLRSWLTIAILVHPIGVELCVDPSSSNPTMPLWDLLCALRQRHARKGCSSKCYHTAENREFNKPWPGVALDCHTEKYDLTRHITQLHHCPVASCFIPPQMLTQDCIRLVCSCSAMEAHSWSSSHTVFDDRKCLKLWDYRVGSKLVTSTHSSLAVT